VSRAARGLRRLFTLDTPSTVLPSQGQTSSTSLTLARAGVDFAFAFGCRLLATRVERQAAKGRCGGRGFYGRNRPTLTAYGRE